MQQSYCYKINEENNASQPNINVAIAYEACAPLYLCNINTKNPHYESRYFNNKKPKRDRDSSFGQED